MPTTAATQGGTAAEVDISEQPWTNPTNAVTDNNGYATATVGSGTIVQSNKLDITNFGFALGSNDTVTTIQVEVACKDSEVSPSSEWCSLQLLKAGSPAGTEIDPATTLTAAESYLSYSGTVVGTYGTTLTGAQANHSGFGVRIQLRNAFADSTVSVDAVRLTLTYEASGGGDDLCEEGGW